jgi:hypothetical protein
VTALFALATGVLRGPTDFGGGADPAHPGADGGRGLAARRGGRARRDRAGPGRLERGRSAAAVRLRGGPGGAGRPVLPLPGARARPDGHGLPARHPERGRPGERGPVPRRAARSSAGRVRSGQVRSGQVRVAARTGVRRVPPRRTSPHAVSEQRQSDGRRRQSACARSVQQDSEPPDRRQDRRADHHGPGPRRYPGCLGGLAVAEEDQWRYARRGHRSHRPTCRMAARDLPGRPTRQVTGGTRSRRRRPVRRAGPRPPRSSRPAPAVVRG